MIMFSVRRLTYSHWIDQLGLPVFRYKQLNPAISVSAEQALLKHSCSTITSVSVILSERVSVVIRF